jgi:hypothetical protein
LFFFHPTKNTPQTQPPKTAHTPKKNTTPEGVAFGYYMYRYDFLLLAIYIFLLS